LKLIPACFNQLKSTNHALMGLSRCPTPPTATEQHQSL
jgi:hypothetical protein